MLLPILILEVANAGHQTIIHDLGTGFEEIDELIRFDHEVKTDFVTPIIIDLPEGPNKVRVFSYISFVLSVVLRKLNKHLWLLNTLSEAKSQLMFQSALTKMIDDAKISDFHQNLTSESYSCNHLGYEPCPDGFTNLTIGKRFWAF